MKASGRLDPWAERISAAFDEGIAQVTEKIDLPDVDVVVVDNPEGTIPDTGSGGYTPNAHLLYVRLDPDSSHLQTHFDRTFKSTLAHELNHCARWASVGFGETLLEIAVSEGLADHFDVEINGGDPTQWSVAFKGKELEEIFEKAKNVFDVPCNEPEWFFGAGDIPMWAGYSIGYKIVGDHMQTTGKKASELVDTPAKEFVTVIQ